MSDSTQHDVLGLESFLGISFRHKPYLIQALTHRSYINENPGAVISHNERLEFLGDAVLELVVSEYLYRLYDNPEGDLTNWRAALVNAVMLAEIGAEIGLEPYMLLSRGEAKDVNSKARQIIIANAMEAFIGALYMDQGYKACELFIHRWILPKLPYILEHKLYLDPKSHFQEKAQEVYGQTPTYTVLGEVGPDHAKRFTVAVLIGTEQIAVGEGNSKQEAQVDAAKNGLALKGWV